MKAWPDRPRVEATMLNPALFAALIAVAARDYEAHAGEAMMWPIGFLLPPLVLHRPTRDALPASTRTHFSTWVRREPLIRAGFPARAADLTALTREGLRAGLRAGVLTIDDGRLTGTLTTPTAGGELGEILKAAALVGRWLAKLDQPSTAFALLGVRP
jgi:hypothetical protein